MKVSKNQIINGVIAFAEKDLIPKIEDKPVKVVSAAALLLLAGNHALADPIFEHKFFKFFLKPDSDGLYEIDGMFEALEKSVETHGGLPLRLPTIPVLSPDEKALTLKVADIAELKRKISDASND